MKRITLITLASLVLFATAASAHQNNMGNNHMRENGYMQQTGYMSGGCPMNGNMMGQGMMNGNMGMMRAGMSGNTTVDSQISNWRANPSYQGQVDTTATDK